jgi:arylsulfatase A-like enzyme
MTSCRGRPSGPNVLLVTIETLRHDRLGAVRNGVALTPHLDRLAKSGVRFDRTYAASSFTLPSLHTIATGEPPPVHRVRFWTQFGNRFRGPTLAGVFQEARYRTGFSYAAYIDLACYPILQRGWDEPPASFPQADAAPVFAAAKAWLDVHGKEPFFLWLHLFEPHTPYGPADEFVTGLANVDVFHGTGPATFPVQAWVDKVPDGGGAALADALYDADVRAADAAVGRILADLEARGLSSTTVVCVVADHGENLAADPAPRWDHGISTDEQLVRVPMILAGPGVPAGTVDSNIARHLDVAPTLLRLAGLDPPREWRGRDLLGKSPAPVFAVSECTVDERHDAPFYSVTDGARSLRLFTATAPWRVELRDERSRGAAPIAIDMREPLAIAASHVAAWMEESAWVTTRAAEVNDPGPDEGALTPEQKRALEIGYMGGEKKPK